MSDKRRAEIEAKKAKLNELRKARAERQKAEAEKRQEVWKTLSFIITFSIQSLFLCLS